jgi:flagellar motor switch protein FliG
LNPRPLTGPEKAVLLLLSLEESAAQPIVAELSPENVKRLREAAREMRVIPANALDDVYTEFLNKSKGAVAVPRGGLDFLRKLAAKALGEPRTQEIFEDKPVSALDRIAAADASALAGLLEHEHPQLVAALLSQLPPEKAASILELLPEETRPQVLSRLGWMTEIPSRLVDEIATAIAAELPKPGADGAVAVDGVSRSAALVRSLSKETCEALLGHIAAEHETLAIEIRRAMYSFEDLKKLDPRSMRELLKAVAGDRLTLALKTASPELANQIYTSMSKRAAERIKEDLTLLGAVRLSDVEEAQHEIVETALRLEADGVLSLSNGGAEVLV